MFVNKRNYFCWIFTSFKKFKKNYNKMQCGHVGRVRTLYKAILRLHRGLPQELQLLGDNYVKDEFRRNKTCSTSEANVFMFEWTNYAISLATQLGIKGPTTAKPLGSPIDGKLLDEMTEDQLQQLYDLMQAAKGEKSENGS